MLTQLKTNHNYRTSLLCLAIAAVGYTALKLAQNRYIPSNRIAGAECFLAIFVVAAGLLALSKWQKERAARDRRSKEKWMRIGLGGAVEYYMRRGYWRRWRKANDKEVRLQGVQDR